MGVLMKLIPQIHIFVINLQVKIIAGILLMMLFAVPMGQFIDRYIGTLFEGMYRSCFCNCEEQRYERQVVNGGSG